MRQSSDSNARGAGLILVLVGLGSALCYAAALTHFPLLAIYTQPIQNLTKLTNSDPRTGLALTGWTLLVFAGYAMGALVLARVAQQSVRAIAHPVTSSPLDFAQGRPRHPACGAGRLPANLSCAADAGVPHHLSRSLRLHVPRA